MTADADVMFEPLPGPRAELGESPVWCASSGTVWWVDIDGRRLNRTRITDGAADSWATPETPGFVVLTDTGKPAVGMETGIFLFDPATVSFERIVDIAVRGSDLSRIRFNDATVDPTGRLWATTLDMVDFAPVGTLCRLDPGLVLTTVAEGLRTPNGLAADGNRGRVYLSDSNPQVQAVWTLPIDLATGVAGSREPFCAFEALSGRPDGAAVDGDGNYWIAGVGGGVVHVFAPDGTHSHEIATPVAAPTKPAFGGADGSTVFLTSKGGPEPDGALAAAPLAGTGFTGAPIPAWRISA